MPDLVLEPRGPFSLQATGAWAGVLLRAGER